MKYLLSLKDERTGDSAYIHVFAPVEDGTIICWGADCTQEDGLRRWKVMSCTCAQFSVSAVR